MTDDLLKRAEPFLNQCGSCDLGLPYAYTCPTGDYRPVVLDLVREVERLRSVAWKFHRAVHDQHEMAGHFLEADCGLCQLAIEEGNPAFACADYKRWQKSYTDILGEVIEEVPR